jgi:hypothetical protein
MIIKKLIKNKNQRRVESHLSQAGKCSANQRLNSATKYRSRKNKPINNNTLITSGIITKRLNPGLAINVKPSRK